MAREPLGSVPITARLPGTECGVMSVDYGSPPGSRRFAVTCHLVPLMAPGRRRCRRPPAEDAEDHHASRRESELFRIWLHGRVGDRSARPRETPDPRGPQDHAASVVATVSVWSPKLATRSSRPPSASM